jgi:hypothetical protein
MDLMHQLINEWVRYSLRNTSLRTTITARQKRDKQDNKYWLRRDEDCNKCQPRPDSGCSKYHSVWPGHFRGDHPKQVEDNLVAPDQ